MKYLFFMSTIMMTFTLQAADRRIFETDSSGNRKYDKPSYTLTDNGRIYETDSSGNHKYSGQHFRIDGNRILPTDSSGNRLYNLPSRTRLNTIEKKVDGIIEKLESIQSNSDKREIRTHLTGIKSSFDYLIPSASKSKIEDIQRDLSRGFSGLNIFLKDKIYANPTLVDLDDINFLYNVLTIAAMGEFRGFIILDDTQGAKHILHQRKSDLRDFKKSLIYISKSLCSDENKLSNTQFNDKKEQFKSLVNNVTDCYADFDSQGIIVSEYLDKRKIRLKHYYEDMENEDTDEAIVVIPHLPSSKLR